MRSGTVGTKSDGRCRSAVLSREGAATPLEWRNRIQLASRTSGIQLLQQLSQVLIGFICLYVVCLRIAYWILSAGSESDSSHTVVTFGSVNREGQSTPVFRSGHLTEKPTPSTSA